MTTTQQNKTQQNRHPSWSPAIVIALIIAIATLGALSVRQYKQIQQLKSANRYALSDHDKHTRKLVAQLTRLQHDFNQRIDQSEQVIGELVNQYQGTQNFVEQLSTGVCLIQGEYIFVEPDTNLPLRYLTDFSPGDTPDNQTLNHTNDLTDNKGQPFPVSPQGQGPTLLSQFTGTGFLIDQRGYVVTNRHVTNPWNFTDEYQHIIAAGYEPQLVMFRAFFPQHNNWFPLEVAILSPDNDIAILQCDISQTNLKPLPCHRGTDGLKVGQTVVVLGYPTGFDLLLARMSQTQLDQILGTDGISFDKMALNLAQLGLIEPMATRGMCGRIHGQKIAYDAQTTIGASGAPVINAAGKVVAINTALLKGFPGTNFGIPIDCALDLLQNIPEPPPQQIVTATNNATNGM
jgi:S1-C subfamily serine protease